MTTFLKKSLKRTNKLLKKHNLPEVDKHNDQACLNALRVLFETKLAGVASELEVAQALARSVKLGFVYAKAHTHTLSLIFHGLSLT